MKGSAMATGIAILACATSPALAAGGVAASRSIHEWYAMGGPAMHALALISVLILALILERAYALRAAAFAPASLVASISMAIEVGNRLELKTVCEQGHSALARLGRLALQGPGSRERLEAQGAAAAHEANRNLPMLAALGNLATMLGLLGTVLGMVEAFEVIAQAGTGDARIVAGGIFRALVTTAAGLSIGVVALAAHAFFSRRASDYVVTLETLVTDVATSIDPNARRIESGDGLGVL